MTNTDLHRAKTLIASIPDYPEPGVNFRDISPLLADGAAMRAVTEALIAPFEGQFDIVGGLEARGFLFAGTIAAMTGVGILPIRKAGKLPRPAAAVSYSLEYGTATIEGPDVLKEGERVLLVDDILATGGTLTAAQALVKELGADVIGSAVVLELEALDGRSLTGDVHTVFTD
ncbi:MULTISPECIES: adenine phosphoribosyltransferase [Brevibacterium]|uniref:Adenine phosphoribosyltransferase n=3 Tax=Brevibacterium TaxID=1696 RepID=A0A2H1JBK6_9MICO|nr:MULTISPECIES: adenine phosphoribosyltransferase [Brevibacterium]SMX71191.1 adenine phosphoribosyltransferase [Brevibacterium antiquum]SMX84870.1 adenine phosphoribosyltransferase [Brevibacterium antiquum CNRZ 918]HCG57109.1 adenine phosphoribosyltransferase [Brevibacterium sp.]